ncbi:nicotinate-nicotinamide nucleotide adenylyltransferase [Vibrio sp. 404]|uniref:nicotinate-nucleotide adenylyltransferase n=1 Tax=Vibrio marinisediminis TaxID=2758441 RepID=A0A7W2ISA4_9VIBR|nr:nicotinate-nicotinamide nucleotide adenylyltransferase [Vibrio marinisediminis]MBA5760927.1 nicotinate-nicotinamide nucleotide adenylyltransferase [Vibrio marinisediminis]
MTKIAVFGSAFNPPSLGHRSVIESLGHFDRVLLVPSIAHAWGKEMLDYSLRVELIDAFIEDMALKNVARSTIEEQLFSVTQQPVTTYAVLCALQEEIPQAQLTFVMGPDNLFNFSKFYRAKDIAKRWTVMACPEKVAVRSTDIRTALDKKQSIEHLTTAKVCTILTENHYY